MEGFECHVQEGRLYPVSIKKQLKGFYTQSCEVHRTVFQEYKSTKWQSTRDMLEMWRPDTESGKNLYNVVIGKM